MGLNLWGSSCSCTPKSIKGSFCNCIPRKSKKSSIDPTAKFGNPNPRNFQIMEVYSIKSFCAMKVKYPDSHNYEGIKILVYALPASDVANREVLDPHFCDSKNCVSPIARFVPTVEGWELAVSLVKQLASKII